MKDKLVIALTAYARCGKNYIADKLTEAYEQQGLVVEEIAFADSLKIITADIVNEDVVILDTMKNNDEKVCMHYEQVLVRDILTRVASSIKKVDDGFFARETLTRVNDSTADIVIITDLRFLVEESMLKTSYPASKVVKITRNGKDCKKRSGDVEVDLLKHDMVFINDGTVNVDELMASIGSK